MKVPRHPHSGRSLALRLVPSKRPNRWLNSADRVEAQDVPLVEPRAAMKKRWTGGTAMKAMTKTIVAVKSVGIMMTPNHPM